MKIKNKREAHMGLKSWLTKFGSVMKIIITDVDVVEKKAEPIVEELLPASVPLFNVFDIGVEIAKNVQAGFAAAGLETSGPAMLKAALPSLSAAVDQYTLAKFPGSQDVLKAEAYLAAKPVLMNAIVQYANALPDTLDVKPTSTAILAAGIGAQVAAAATPAKAA
jgi:hypothetical protein